MIKAYLHYNNSVYPIVKSTFRVGRNSYCDIVINDQYVSSVHFCIQKSGESFIFCDGDMRDKASKNGSTVDDVFVNNRDCIYLRHSSIISIRNITMRFILEVVNNDKSKDTSAYT